MDSRHCEAMNVLNYPKGGQYQDHFDWTADGEVSNREQQQLSDQAVA